MDGGAKKFSKIEKLKGASDQKVKETGRTETFCAGDTKGISICNNISIQSVKVLKNMLCNGASA